MNARSFSLHGRILEGGGSSNEALSERERGRSSTRIHVSEPCAPRERSQAAALRVWFFLLALGYGGLLSGQSAPGDWTIDASRSRLTVMVLPAGLFASALHTHFFQPEDWGGEVAWDPDHPGSARVRVRIASDSLRDHQPELSAKDVARVESQVRGPDILDSARFPKILFEAGKLDTAQPPSGAAGEFRGTLAGTLTLRGQSRPVEFPIRGSFSGERIVADAKVTFRQSDFGIKPYRTALGTIAVRDEVTIEIALVAIPRRH